MTNTRRYLSAALAGLLLISGAASAHASPRSVYKMPKAEQSLMPSHFAAPVKTRRLLAQNKISASQAKSIARSRVPGGEVVDISKSGNTYRVRVIARDGRVVDVYIDANTGRVKR